MEFKFAPVDSEVDESGTFSGYASRFGLKDQGGDTVIAGAFAKSLSQRAPAMLWQHDPSRPIGVWTKAEEDSTGLRVEGKIDMNVRQGMEAHSLLKSGGIKGLSIGYRTRKADRVKGGRELKELELWEVSLVTFPMQIEASVDSVKDIEGIVPMKRFVERLLREADFSTDEAKAAAAAVARVREEREAPADHSEMLETIKRTIRGL